MKEDERISRKRYTPEQIISMLREAEVALSQGQTVGQVCRVLGVSEQSYYRWRREYGGLKIDQAKRLKELEKAPARGIDTRRFLGIVWRGSLYRSGPAIG